VPPLVELRLRRVLCFAGAGSTVTPGQSLSHGTSGRVKSGPTAVQPPASSAAITAARQACRRFIQTTVIESAVDGASLATGPVYTQLMKI
jgi:hypothetical protein